MSRKYYNNKIFSFDGGYIVCDTQDTSYGFRHVGTLSLHNGIRKEDKCTYYNRTWERFTYQSLIWKLLEGVENSEAIKAEIEKEGAENVSEELRAMRGIVEMAGLFHERTSDQTEAKIRALELVTGGQVTRPEDWDELTEETKSFRLKKALEVLN